MLKFDKLKKIQSCYISKLLHLLSQSNLELLPKFVNGPYVDYIWIV